MDSSQLRVVLVDDHMLLRSAIRQTLEAAGMAVVGEAGSAEEALTLVLDVKPDVMLIDINLPAMTGVQLVRELAPRLPDTHLIMLTGSSSHADVFEAIRYGASGYLTKDMPPHALVRAVLGVRSGALPMPRHLAARVVKDLAHHIRSGGQGGDQEDGLSERELEVLAQVAEGRTDREIGDILGISPRTVGRHVGNILDKLGVRNRAEAAAVYRSSRPR